MNEEGKIVPQLLAVLNRRIKKKNNRAMTEVLIQWKELIQRKLYGESYIKCSFNFQTLIGVVRSGR